MKTLMLVVLALAALALPVAAQTVDPVYPWYDLQHRLTVGASMRYQWFAATDGDADPVTPKEFVAGPVMAYELTEHFTLVSNIMYGFDSKQVVTQIGLTVPIYGSK